MNYEDKRYNKGGSQPNRESTRMELQPMQPKMDPSRDRLNMSRPRQIR